MTDDTWYSDPTHMAVSKASAKLNWKPGDEKERAEDFTNTSYSMAGQTYCLCDLKLYNPWQQGEINQKQSAVWE